MKLTLKATAFAFAIMFTGQVFGATVPAQFEALSKRSVTTQTIYQTAADYREALIAHKNVDDATFALILSQVKTFMDNAFLTCNSEKELASVKLNLNQITGAIAAKLGKFEEYNELSNHIDTLYPNFDAVQAQRAALAPKNTVVIEIENIVKPNIVEIVEIVEEDKSVVQETAPANLLQFIPLVDNFTSTTNVDTAAVDSVVKPNVTTSIEEDDDYAKAVLADVAAQIEAEKEAAAKLANQPESEFVQAVLADFTAQTEAEQAIVQAKEDREKAQQKAAQEAAERAQAPFLSTNKAIALSAGMVGATVYALDGGARILNLDTNGNGVSDIDEAYNALVTTDLNGNGVADVTEIQNAALAAQDGVVDTYNSAYEAAVAAKEAVMYELGIGTLPTSRADALAKQARENEAKRIAAEELARQEELARIAALEQAARDKANSAGCVSWIRSWFNDCPVQK